MSQRQIILDTETTGLYPENGDRLVEFAGLEMIQPPNDRLHPSFICPPRARYAGGSGEGAWFDD